MNKLNLKNKLSFKSAIFGAMLVCGSMIGTSDVFSETIDDQLMNKAYEFYEKFEKNNNSDFARETFSGFYYDSDDLFDDINDLYYRFIGQDGNNIPEENRTQLQLSIINSALEFYISLFNFIATSDDTYISDLFSKTFSNISAMLNNKCKLSELEGYMKIIFKYYDTMKKNSKRYVGSFDYFANELFNAMNNTHIEADSIANMNTNDRNKKILDLWINDIIPQYINNFSNRQVKSYNRPMHITEFFQGVECIGKVQSLGDVKDLLIQAENVFFSHNRSSFRHICSLGYKLYKKNNYQIRDFTEEIKSTIDEIEEHNNRLYKKI